MSRLSNWVIIGVLAALILAAWIASIWFPQ